MFMVQYIRSHKGTDQLLAPGPSEKLTVRFRIIKPTRGVHRLQIAEYVRRKQRSKGSVTSLGPLFEINKFLYSRSLYLRV
jgi:hypothetical protein